MPRTPSSLMSQDASIKASKLTTLFGLFNLLQLPRLDPYARDLRCSRPFQDRNAASLAAAAAGELAVNRVKFSLPPRFNNPRASGGENRAGPAPKT